MKYWKIVENLNDVSNQLFSSIYVNFLRIQTDGIIKWNHQPCPFCQMRQVHQTISCHLQFLYSSENIPINIINQHANPKIKFSSHVHEHIKKKRFSERGKKSNHKACQFWSSCHHWPQPWKKRSFWQEKAGLWLLSSQHWKEMVSSSMSSSLRLPFQSSSIFFSPSFLPDQISSGVASFVFAVVTLRPQPEGVIMGKTSGSGCVVGLWIWCYNIITIFSTLLTTSGVTKDPHISMYQPMCWRRVDMGLPFEDWPFVLYHYNF